MLKVLTTENLQSVLGQAAITATLPEPVSDWCMLLARSPREQEARDSLRRMGVGAWWPNYKREVAAKDNHTGKRHTRLVLTGILPGVILSPARMDERFWRAIDLAPGVMNVARKSNGDLLLLSDVDIVVIHKIESGQNRPPPPTAPTRRFSMGDMVMFVDDSSGRLPWGKIVKVARDGRLTVEVNIFGRMTPIAVPPHQIDLV